MSKLKVKTGGVKNLNPIKYLYFIIIYCIIITGSTYAYQYINATNSNITGMGGCFNVNYTGENITASSITSTVDYENGSKTTVTLSKHSSCKLYTEANIYLHTNNTTTAPIDTVQALKYRIAKENNTIGAGTIDAKGDFLLVTVPLTDTPITYTVYLYIDPNISIGQYDGTLYSGYIYADSHQTSTIPKAVFLPGPEVNIKIKNLAGDNATSTNTVNSSITSIVRSNTLDITPTSNNIVSTNDSSIPIYVWFDNGIIYYYSDMDTIYMNTNSSYMFTNLDKTTSIDLSSIDTSDVTNMQSLFEYSNSLKIIDISNFNTGNVTNMKYMFDMQSGHDAKLETIIFGKNFNTSKVTTMRYMICNSPHMQEIDLSKFDTSNVTDMHGMFANDTSLTKLDLGNFDMSSITDVDDVMLYNTPLLKHIKTPKVYPSNSNLSIKLHKTFYDSNNNTYTTLNNTSPTSIWLRVK